MWQDTIDHVKACMFHDIHNRESPVCKISKAGFDVIFIEEQCGRHDVSSNSEVALRQAESAGLDIRVSKDIVLSPYLEWRNKVHLERDIAEAVFKVSNRTLLQRVNNLVPVHTVSLIDGWGNTICFASVDCLSIYDSEALNQIHQKGAFINHPDEDGIEKAISHFRKQVPHLAHAPVIYNYKNNQ